MVRTIVIFVLLVASQVAPAEARCSCAEVAPACDAFWASDVVFSGTVVDITDIPPPAPRTPGMVGGKPAPPPLPFPTFYRKVRIRSDQVWRGGVGGEVEIYTGQSDADCGIPFVEGEKYLVYARRFGGQIQTTRCSRTARMPDAREDEEYIGRLKKPSSGGRIFGTATLGDAEPAANYTVLLGNETGEWRAVTNARGEFEFLNRAPGKYGITIDVPDTFRKSGPTLVNLRDVQACVKASFRLRPDSRVALSVLDSQVKPAVRTTLELIAADSLASGSPVVTTAQVLPDGRVEWADVTPGRYVIGLNVTQPPDPARPRPSLFYPGVTDPASAHRFEVGMGERVDLDTLRLPPTPPRQRITGVVLRADGSPVRGADIALKSAAPFARGRVVGRSVRTGADGRFSIAAVQGHRYFVEVLLGVDGENRQFFAASDVFELTEKTPALTLQRKKGTRPAR